MHFFYLHVPWKIDEEEYNCSLKSYSEWKSLGSVNTLEGSYFAVMGTAFAVLYALCLFGMYRGSLLKIPCYKLIFFNGMVDIVDLLLCSNILAYLSFIGAVFCSAKTFDWIAGHIIYSLWLGASFNCVVLACNRFVEMIPFANGLRFLFRGKTLYVWFAFSLFYMLTAWFALRPLPYNTAVAAFIATPMIRDFEWEYSHYTSVYQLCHNCAIVVIMTTAYSFLYRHVKKTRARSHQSENMKIFLQVFLICLSTGFTAILYIMAEFLAVPKSMVIAAHVIWQLSHGVHGIIFFCFNKTIRREVIGVFTKSRHDCHFTETAVSNLRTSFATVPSKQ